MTSRLTKTGVEYLDYTWNFYSGCLHRKTGICPVPNCWAQGITERFPDKYPEGFDPDIHYEALKPFKLRKPQRVGVCFMGDLVGSWVRPLEVDETGRLLTVSGEATLRDAVFQVLLINHLSKFFFLTKNPAGYLPWGKFPANAWLGATVCNQEMLIDALDNLQKKQAHHRWLSIEPLLEDLNGGECEGKRLDGLKAAGVEWLVIGSQSKPKKLPEWDWVREIIQAADSAGIPVFLKDNLGLPRVSCDGGIPFYKRDPSGTMVLRQELPT